MLKNITRLEHKVGEKVYHFLCDNDSPVHEAKEAVMQFLKYIMSVEDAAKVQQELAKQQVSDDDKKEEVLEEVKAE